MRKVLFVGPTYPPANLQNYIHDIAVNIYTRDYVRNTLAAAYEPPYIKNVSISDGQVYGELRCVNPATMEIIECSLTGDNVVILTKAIDPPAIGSTGTTYNISPCCVSLTYPPANNNTDIEISCNYPIKCEFTGSVLNITAVGIEDTIEDTTNITPTGITAINGISDNAGNININGVGGTIVTVMGNSEGLE